MRCLWVISRSDVSHVSKGVLGFRVFDSLQSNFMLSHLVAATIRRSLSGNSVVFRKIETHNRQEVKRAAIRKFQIFTTSKHTQLSQSYPYTIAGHMPSVCSSSPVLILERISTCVNGVNLKNICHRFSGTNALIMLLSCVSMDNSLPLFSPMSLILKSYPLKVGESPGQPFQDSFHWAPRFVTCSSMPKGFCCRIQHLLLSLVKAFHQPARWVNFQFSHMEQTHSSYEQNMKRNWGANPSKQNSWA